MIFSYSDQKQVHDITGMRLIYVRTFIDRVSHNNEAIAEHNGQQQVDECWFPPRDMISQNANYLNTHVRKLLYNIVTLSDQRWKEDKLALWCYPTAIIARTLANVHAACLSISNWSIAGKKPANCMDTLPAYRIISRSIVLLAWFSAR